LSSRTGTVIGAPLAFQSGISWLRPTGSRTAPDRICAPTSEPFSSTTTFEIRVDLFQPDRRRQARGARAHDDDVVFHAFAFNLGHRVPLVSQSGRAAARHATKFRGCVVKLAPGSISTLRSE
jgi:hypothetical protein